MKKITFILSSLLILIAALLFLSTMESCNPFLSLVAEGVNIKSANLFKNPDFKDGFKEWNCDDKITLQETNEVKYVCIKKTGKDQTRIWQEVNVVSGKTYKLSFKLDGIGTGAFVIYVGPKSYKEDYFWCKDNNKEYLFDIIPVNTGKSKIYFSTQIKGIYNFSRFSFKSYNTNLIVVYRIISLFISVCCLILLIKIGFVSYLYYKFLALTNNKYVKLLFFISLFATFILISIFYLGLCNNLIFFVWWLYFSCLHYLIGNKGKCPDTLTPPVTLALIIIVLNISGLCGSLNYGFYLLLSFGVFGLIIIFKEFKTAFWKGIVFQPNIIWCYYILAFVLFIQAIKLGDGVKNFDDIHHWMLIIKGMGYYNRITDFPRLTIFDHYTIGSALWGYFINRLSGYQFSFSITNWSNTLITAACFIPGLCFVKMGKKTTPLLSVVLLLAAYVFLLYPSTLLKALGCISILLALCFIPKQLSSYLQTLLLISYFLIYCFLLITPGDFQYFDSHYRNLAPDIIIFTVSAAALMAYMSKPNLKTILYICPLLSLVYLLKKPGLYLSITVGITILIHYSIWKYKSIYRLLSSKKKIVVYYFLSVALIASALILPPLIWGAHCKSSKSSIKTNYNFDNIKKCFSEKDNQLYVITRKNYIDKLFNEPLIILKGSKVFKPILSLANKYNNSYALYFSLLFISQFIIIIVFLLSKKFRCFSIIGFLILFSTIIYTISLYINYCLWFGSTYEKYIIPHFQRYASPMIKILFLVIYCYLCYYHNNSKCKLSKSISLFVIIIMALLSLLSDNSIHISKRYYNCPIASALKTVPNDFDFSNKNLFVISENYGTSKNNYLSFLLLKMNKSYPRFAKINNYGDKIDKYENFDLFWCIRTDFNKSISKSLNYYSDFFNVKPDLLLDNSCLFNRNSSSEFSLVFKNRIKNLITNGNFQNGFDGWKYSDDIILNSDHNNDLTTILFPGKNGSISQTVTLKSNHYYRILANFNGLKSYSTIAKIGNRKLYPSYDLTKLDVYFLSKTNENALLLFEPKNNIVEISNIKLIDLNCDDCD